MHETRLLLCRLLGLTGAEVPEGHYEVAAFAGLGREAMIEKLTALVPCESIALGYQALFPESAAVEAAHAARLYWAHASRAAAAAATATNDDQASSALAYWDAVNAGITAAFAGSLSAEGLGTEVGAAEAYGGKADTAATQARKAQEAGRLLDAKRGWALAAEAAADATLSFDVGEEGTGYGDQASLLNPRPDKTKVRKLVDALDTSGDGFLSRDEVKLLFSKLLGVDPTAIPDDHPEVAAYSGLATNAVVQRVVEVASKEKVDAWYEALFPEVPREFRNPSPPTRSPSSV